MNRPATHHRHHHLYHTSPLIHPAAEGATSILALGDNIRTPLENQDHIKRLDRRSDPGLLLRRILENAIVMPTNQRVGNTGNIRPPLQIVMSLATLHRANSCIRPAVEDETSTPTIRDNTGTPFQNQDLSKRLDSGLDPGLDPLMLIHLSSAPVPPRDQITHDILRPGPDLGLLPVIRHPNQSLSSFIYIIAQIQPRDQRVQALPSQQTQPNRYRKVHTHPAAVLMQRTSCILEYVRLDIHKAL